MSGTCVATARCSTGWRAGPAFQPRGARACCLWLQGRGVGCLLCIHTAPPVTACSHSISPCSMSFLYSTSLPSSLSVDCCLGRVPQPAACAGVCALGLKVCQGGFLGRLDTTPNTVQTPNTMQWHDILLHMLQPDAFVSSIVEHSAPIASRCRAAARVAVQLPCHVQGSLALRCVLA